MLKCITFQRGEKGSALTPEERILKASACLRAGLVAEEAKQWNRALRHYHDALSWDPNFLPALFRVGTSLLCRRSGKMKVLAEKYFLRALEQRPRNSTILVALARSWQYRHGSRRSPPLSPQALEYYKRALRVDPNCEPAHLELGAAYSEIAGAERLAIKHFSSYLSLTIGEGPLVRKVIEEDIRRLRQQIAAKSA